MDKAKEKIMLYSYRKVWKVEKKIYAIQNIVLPVPIDPWQILYFCVTWVICYVIFRLIPGGSSVPVVIRSMIIPFAISQFCMTKKLDGKNPLRYMAGIIIFLFLEQGKNTEHFKTSAEKAETIKLNWKSSEGVYSKGE